MTANAKFFSDDKGPAAVLKHGTLRRYLATFAGATSSTSPGHRVGYLDGYAGEGEYQNPVTGVTSEGSPRIALRIASDLRGQKRELRCIFVEKVPKAFTSLENVVADANDPHAQAFKGDIASHLDDAMRTFEDMPALVFLDPFGTALDHEATVNAILRRSGNYPTELLLNFSLQAVRRMGARIWEREGAQGREKTLERMDSWLGGTWWRNAFLSPDLLSLPKEERANAAAERVAATYAKRICDATGCGGFKVPIRRSPKDKPLFWLILFFPRNLAAFKFNEAVSKALEDWRAFLHDIDLAEAEKEDASDPQLFPRVDELNAVFAADERDTNRGAIDAIKTSIREALETRTSLSVTKDLRLVMGEALGVGRTTHLRTAWKELAAEGVVIECPKGALDSGIIARAN